MMQRAYILGDTGKAIVLSFLRGNEEICRRVFPYREGYDKPSVVAFARSSAEALVNNTEFFTRH